MIRKAFRKAKERPFLLHVLTLMTGTALAQAILFLFTPLLTRLFDPSAFGVFALYTAIVSTLGVVAAWKYELAIMLPAKDEDARGLVWLSFWATTLSSGLILLISLVLREPLISWFGEELRAILFIIPLGIFFSSLYQIMLSYGSRYKEFPAVSASRVVQASAAVGSQSAIQIFRLFPLGLVWGKVFADVAAAVMLGWRHWRKGRFKGKAIGLAIMKRLGREHHQFPRYQSFASLMNSLSQNLPAILLTFYYSPAIAGLYALTARVLSAPTRLIGHSTREVYYQEASRQYADGKPILRLFKNTLGGLIRVGILPFLILFFLAPFLFSVLFGEEWQEAGHYAQLVIPWSFLGFINSPATMSLYVLGLQRFSMRYETALFIARFLSLWISWVILEDPYLSIAVYAATGLLFNVYLILYAYRKVSLDARRRRQP
jgi:O-antigen/teichoic acid export membrane protein